MKTCKRCGMQIGYETNLSQHSDPDDCIRALQANAKREHTDAASFDRLVRRTSGVIFFAGRRSGLRNGADDREAVYFDQLLSPGELTGKRVVVTIELEPDHSLEAGAKP